MHVFILFGNLSFLILSTKGRRLLCLRHVPAMQHVSAATPIHACKANKPYIMFSGKNTRRYCLPSKVVAVVGGNRRQERQLWSKYGCCPRSLPLIKLFISKCDEYEINNNQLPFFVLIFRVYTCLRTTSAPRIRRLAPPLVPNVHMPILMSNILYAQFLSTLLIKKFHKLGQVSILISII